MTEKDDNTRGYAVLVSEIMLQQTQVSTVVDYYKKWMKRWPTTAALSAASLDEVNQAWSGLGYYSRGRRLLEAAKVVEQTLNGVMPRTVPALLKLPGVGRYTASAVASIAYGEAVGLVDGNVLRVLSRLRSVGAEIDSSIAVDWMWMTAEAVVDPCRPGDFNQAMMELGATVCSPKSPNCSGCPVRSLCNAKAWNVDSTKDIEESCQLCIRPEAFNLSLGVANFPRKSKKTASREETTLVLALTRPAEGSGKPTFAVQQRPSSGLLANLWELPTSVFSGTADDELGAMEAFMKDRGLAGEHLKRVGEVGHVFSHINMKYVIYSAVSEGKCDLEFVSSQEFISKGTSTAMKKVVKFLESAPQMGKRKTSLDSGKPPKQRPISAFFKVLQPK